MLKNKNKIWLFIELAVIVALGIGYAAINTIVLEIEGTGKADVQEGVFITDVTYTSNVDANLSTSQVKNFIGTTMNSTVELYTIVQPKIVHFLEFFMIQKIMIIQILYLK